MRLPFLSVCFWAVVALSVNAQEGDSTDLSRYEVFKEGETIVSLDRLQTMEDEYKTLVAEAECKEALPMIVAFYEAANKTSNILRRGNEPFYDATRDDRESVGRNRDLLNTLIAAENASNNLIKQRNVAWVEEAKCLLQVGDNDAAIHRLYRALDYIGTDHDEQALWKEARDLLWKEVGFRTDQ